MSLNERMIIVEGMDNSGKSTLCNQLAGLYLDRQVIHSPGPHLGFIGMVDFCVGSVAHPKLYIELLFDRHPAISEHVYGVPIRNTNAMLGWAHSYIKEQADLHAFFITKWTQIQPVVIYCRPPKKNILDFGEREQLGGVISQAQMLIEAYDAKMYDMANSGEAVVIEYDYTTSNPNELYQRMMKETQ